MTSTGMSRTTGEILSDDDHIAQSIGDILTTPLGTRVMRRDYGSMLFELQDQPLNRVTALLLIAASALAIARWEPRIVLTSVQISGDLASGQAVATVAGTRTDQGTNNTLTTLSIPLS